MQVLKYVFKDTPVTGNVIERISSGYVLRKYQINKNAGCELLAEDVLSSDDESDVIHQESFAARVKRLQWYFKGATHISSEVLSILDYDSDTNWGKELEGIVSFD